MQVTASITISITRIKEIPALRPNRIPGSEKKVTEFTGTVDECNRFILLEFLQRGGCEVNIVHATVKLI
jgi:hypothetical protein